MVKEVLAENPTISSFEEFCAVKNIKEDGVNEESKAMCIKAINKSVMRLKSRLKLELYNSTNSNNNKAHELLYRLIGDEDDLKRFGIQSKQDDKKVQVKPVIEIKSADDSVLEKLKNL